MARRRTAALADEPVRGLAWLRPLRRAGLRLAALFGFAVLLRFAVLVGFALLLGFADRGAAAVRFDGLDFARARAAALAAVTTAGAALAPSTPRS